MNNLMKNKYMFRAFMYHAGFINDDGGWDPRPIHEQEDNINRFAKLIIEECIKCSEHHDALAPVRQSAWGEAYEDGWIDGVSNYKNIISRHFGID